MPAAAARYLFGVTPSRTDPLFRARVAASLAGLGMQALVMFGFGLPLLGWVALLVGVWPYRCVVVVTRAGLHRRWLAFRDQIPADEVIGAEVFTGPLGARLRIRRRGAADVVLSGALPSLVALRDDLLATFLHIAQATRVRDTTTSST